MNIQKTTDYDKFRTITGNRVISVHHVANLTVSVSKKNLLEYNPIMVNENMEVIDGQHRLEVAKNNNLPIYYTIVPNTDINDVMDLNANLLKWKLKDYIDSLVARGNREMQFLKEFYEDYRLSPSISIYLLIGSMGIARHTNNTTLSKVSFTEGMRKRAMQIADLYLIVRDAAHQRGLLPLSVAQACSQIVDEGHDKVVAEKIQSTGKSIAVSRDEPVMYRILNNYYLKA